ncbi:MAG: hypothetical protein MK108_09625 [Mariniblastus sp.]|nr:hypothetical protein [Mariniblastus sp.]
MTSTFKRDQIEFTYPETWQLSDTFEDDPLSGEVSLETPEGGFWTLVVFPPDVDAAELLDNAKQGLVDQYQDVEFQVSTSLLDEVYPSIGTDAFFYCLDFLVTANLSVISMPGQTLVVCCQAESREFDEKRDVFAAITSSLLKNLT